MAPGGRPPHPQSLSPRRLRLSQPTASAASSQPSRITLASRATLRICKGTRAQASRVGCCATDGSSRTTPGIGSPARVGLRRRQWRPREPRRIHRAGAQHDHADRRAQAEPVGVRRRPAQSPQDAIIPQIMAATNWHPYSVRGFFAGTVRRKSYWLTCIEEKKIGYTACRRRPRSPAPTATPPSTPTASRAPPGSPLASRWPHPAQSSEKQP